MGCREQLQTLASEVVPPLGTPLLLSEVGTKDRALGTFHLNSSRSISIVLHEEFRSTPRTTLRLFGKRFPRKHGGLLLLLKAGVKKIF